MKFPFLYWCLGLFVSISSCKNAGLPENEIIHESKVTLGKKTLIILAHPNSESFNSSIASELQRAFLNAGHEVRIRDLYSIRFNPILSLEELLDYQIQNAKLAKDIQEEQAHIVWADNLVFVHPTWWWGMPAILKGYFDRVFTPVFAFEEVEGGIKGKLEGKKAFIVQTTGVDQVFLEQHQLDENVKELMDFGILHFCGIEVLEHCFFPNVQGVSQEERKEMLLELRKMVDFWTAN